MAGSRKQSTLGPKTFYHLRDVLAAPERTPGPLGINDAADPSCLSLLGDTPSATGLNDFASPEHYVLPGTRTLHEWSAEARVHIPPEKQTSQIYPAGTVKEVLDQAVQFLVKEELLVDYVYIPGVKPDGTGTPIAYSGITLGVGYDLGQHSEAEIRRDWAELDTHAQPPSISPKGKSFGLPKLEVDPSIMGTAPSMTFDSIKKKGAGPKLSLDPVWTDPSPVDLLARGAHLQRAQAKSYLPQVKHLWIPKQLSLKVLREGSLQDAYKKSLKFFPGLDKLPTGAQVAIVSLVFNSGLTHGKRETPVKYSTGEVAVESPPPSLSFGLKLRPGETTGAIKAKGLNRVSFGIGPLSLGSPAPSPAPKADAPPATIKTSEDDIFGGDWEKKMLTTAVLTRDLVWIYWYFESARRIYPDDAGLIKRREHEADLIRPYVGPDLQYEAFLQRFRNL